MIFSSLIARTSCGFAVLLGSCDDGRWVLSLVVLVLD